MVKFVSCRDGISGPVRAIAAVEAIEAIGAFERQECALVVVAANGPFGVHSGITALAASPAEPGRPLVPRAPLFCQDCERRAERAGAPLNWHEFCEGALAAPGRGHVPPAGQNPVLNRVPRSAPLRDGLPPAGASDLDGVRDMPLATAAGGPGGASVPPGGAGDDLTRDVLSHFECMIEAGLAGIWDWHVQDNAAFMSPRLEEMLGFAAGELGTSAATWRQRVHPEDLPCLQQAFRAHVESHGSKPFDLELRYLRKDGATVWGHCRGRVVAWRGATPVRMMGILSDVTELRRREAALDEIRDLALMAAHDLMAPANTIAGGLSMLQSALGGAIDDEAQQIFGMAGRAVDQLRARISAVVDLFRIESTEVAFEPVDLETCFRDASIWLCDEVARCDAEIRLEPLPRASGAAVLIGQLAQNLLSNALKYRHPERRPIVRVEAFDAGPDMVGIRVSDNGLGIPPEQRERVFELFHRLREDTALAGSGLGLTLCERVVSQHGGRIWVEDADLGGAALLFTLPRGG